MTEYSYIHVRWLHSYPDDPIDLWSELDAEREEVRKVEIWFGGRVDYASDAEGVGGTRLGELPVPPLNEINLDPQCQAKAIAKADFERCWIEAIGKG